MRSFTRSCAAHCTFTLRIMFAQCAILLLTVAPNAWSAETPDKPPLAPAPEYGAIAREFAARLPAMHLDRATLDDIISSRVFNLLLSGFDNDRSLFLASDIEEFKANELLLDDMIKAGNVQFAYDVFDRLKQRVRERRAHVEHLLTNIDSLDMDRDEEYALERDDKAPWPVNTDEQNELWRKKIKDQYIRRLVSDTLSKKETEKEAMRPRKGDNTNTAAQAGPATGGEQNEHEDKGDLVPADNTENGNAKENPGQSGTNNKGKDAETKPVIKTPEESILHQYRQLLTILEDSDTEWVLQQYLSAFARACDPHSDYMSASTTEDFDISMRLSLVGIGAELTSEDGMAKIERLIRGGPAERDGRLKSGDKIIAVAQGGKEPEDVVHWPLNKTVSKIRGKKGTKVTLTVIPASDATGSLTVNVELTRDEVRLEDKAAKGVMSTVRNPNGASVKLGVITLPSFYADMNAKGGFVRKKDFRSSVRDVRNILESDLAGANGIILDLRNNGGGSLEEAIAMTGLFITRGPVVQVKDRYRLQPLYDEDPSVTYGGPMVVLVNRMSASASEILAGALQDYGRAVLVGDSKTHGKGTVQSIATLRSSKGNWGSIKVTSAAFYRFTGESTQIKGVSSDIVVPSAYDMTDVGEESLKYALPCPRIDPVEIEESSTGSLIEELLLGRPMLPRPSKYEPVRNLQSRIEILRRNSEARRVSDARFIANDGFLRRFEERRKEETVRLNLAARLEQAREELRLYDLQKKDLIGKDDEDSDKNTTDLVLEEGLNILADMTATSSDTIGR